MIRHTALGKTIILLDFIALINVNKILWYDCYSTGNRTVFHFYCIK